MEIEKTREILSHASVFVVLSSKYPQRKKFELFPQKHTLLYLNKKVFIFQEIYTSKMSCPCYTSHAINEWVSLKAF